jgi:hypothetical protein
MNTKQFAERFNTLRAKQEKLTNDYIASNKKYNVGDVIRGNVDGNERTILVERVDVETLGDKPHIYYYGKAVRKGTEFYKDNHYEFIFQNEVVKKIKSHINKKEKLA